MLHLHPLDYAAERVARNVGGGVASGEAGAPASVESIERSLQRQHAVAAIAQRRIARRQPPPAAENVRIDVAEFPGAAIDVVRTCERQLLAESQQIRIGELYARAV